MIDLEKTLYDLCLPMTDHPQALSVKTMASSDERDILLYVYADDKDIARLIGRRGGIASALRTLMGAAARKMHKRVLVKFEAY